MSEDLIRKEVEFKIENTKVTYKTKILQYRCNVGLQVGLTWGWFAYSEMSDDRAKRLLQYKILERQEEEILALWKKIKDCQIVMANIENQIKEDKLLENLPNKPLELQQSI